MLLVIDFETYWDRQYTLKKLTPPQYIMDPRFAVHGAAVCRMDFAIHETPPLPLSAEWPQPAWLNAAGLERLFKTLAESKARGTSVGIITYNALFDMGIVAWRYGFVPDIMIDVLGMARAHLGPQLARFDLKTVAAKVGIGEKGDTVEAVPPGMSTAEIIEAGKYENLISYACQDARLTAALYLYFAAKTPMREIKLQDLVIRAAIQPQLELDANVLAEALADSRQKKAALLANCGASKVDLMSADKFAGLLQGYGVVPDTKTSPTGRDIPALAKTDRFMQELVEHPDERVAMLAQARLGMKSTLEETRSQRLLDIANIRNANAGIGAYYPEGMAPIPLKYGAARTHRFGGDWKINLQNLPRGSHMRTAFRAPAGKKVIVADLKQIEARMAAWFCEADILTKQFATKEDPYAKLAEIIFKRPIDPKVDKIERFIGKTGILGLGYGAGAPKFHKMVHTQARLQLGTDIEFSENLSRRTVNAYRTVHHAIPAMWSMLHGYIYDVLITHQYNKALGPLVLQKGKITLPSGLELQYPNIHEEKTHADEHDTAPSSEYVYDDGYSKIKLYGAKLLENIIQALARIVLTDAAVRLHARGYRFAMQVHDELVFVVDEREATEAMETIREEMTVRPFWAENLPLDVDISQPSDTYGDAK